ncbi:MAG TPA: hemerythrin domain-containing protein [Vicinamibacterales bacterium]|nr:hemerythrin domain-containing protein [Vicinamibacterales bacterium]
MATNRTSKQPTSGRAARKRITGTKERDAIAFLSAQHREVEELFKEFEKLGEDGSLDEKEPIVRVACEKLSVHATIEEEIFYPAAREVADVDSLLNEAEVEHATARDLIAQLDAMDAGDELFSATFTVLSEYIKHHVKEEEGELFPKLRRSGMDLDQLGEALAAHADELMATETEM